VFSTSVKLYSFSEGWPQIEGYFKTKRQGLIWDSSIRVFNVRSQKLNICPVLGHAPRTIRTDSVHRQFTAKAVALLCGRHMDKYFLLDEELVAAIFPGSLV
jgi:hypothetical protein